MTQEFPDLTALSPRLDPVLSTKAENFTALILDQVQSQLMASKGADRLRVVAYGVRLVEAVLPRRSYVRHEHANGPSSSPIPTESGGAP